MSSGLLYIKPKNMIASQLSQRLTNDIPDGLE